MSQPDDKRSGNSVQQTTADSIDTIGFETLVAPPASETQPTLNFAAPTVAGEVGELGPYRIVRQLGRGGMGVVYLAFDTRLKRKLALKVMLPQYAANKSSKERFLREARVAAQISHDNIVTIYEADERDGVPFIAMQFLQGYPLNEYLRKSGIPTIPQILQIARETAAGLAAAHHVGLVHRDIKPANLWLEAPNGRVKVLDFGLAKPVDAEVELTKSGVVVGTPAFMSPQQGRGLKVDHRTDLFSLGAVLYRICTGKLPFDGPTTMAVLMALGTEEPTPVRELNPDVPASLAALIDQLLAKNPNDRPRSADEVVKRICAIADQLATPQPIAMTPQPQVIYIPIEVTPQQQTSPFADLDETQFETVSGEPKPTPKSVRQRADGKGMWIAAGFAVFLAVAIVAGVIIIIKNKDGTETKIEVPDDATVTIKNKDGKTIAQVKPDGKQPNASTIRDRKAAEYALSIGGGVCVNGEDREIEDTLPSDHFTLTGVSFSNNKAVTDKGLAVFKDCKNLMDLWLDHTPVTDAGLANFKDCKNLTMLDLYDTRITDAGLMNFKGCKELTLLGLGETPVTDAGLANFKDCKNLTVLGLQKAKVTDTGLANFKDCPNLLELYLPDTQVTDAGLIHFKDCPNLTLINFSNTRVTDVGLEHFKNCKALEYLMCESTKLTDVGLAHFQDCKSLMYLNVRNTKVSAKFIEKFGKAQPQCKISYDGGTIEPTVVVDPDRKAAAYVLSIGGSVKVNDEDREVKAATDLPRDSFILKCVNLEGNKKVTDAALVHFKRCKSLTEIYLGVTQLTDAGLVNFKACKNLLVLDLAYLPVTDTGLANFKDCKGLTFLNLTGTPVTDAGLAHFKDCKNLTLLSMPGSRVTDAGLAYFKDCKSLGHLNLSGTGVTNAGLANFKDCKDLTHFHLHDMQMSDVGLANFKDCKNATELHLSNTQVSDAGLAAFKNCKSLTYLDVRKTKVSPKFITEFSKAQPQCKIEHDGGVIEPK